jgi:hypothetical protein
MVVRTALVLWLVLAAITAGRAESSLRERIDARIADGWKARGVTAAPRCDDAEFLRRVYLDLVGLVPTSLQAREFLADTGTDKRERLIQRLLDSPEYSLHMARVYDVMIVERRVPSITSYDVKPADWRSYLTQAFAENRPWDQLVREILASDGNEGPTAAGVKFFLVRDVAPHQLTRDIGRIFLGADLQCAQCHDDPRFDDYRQADYYGVHAFVQRVTAFRDNEKNVSLVGETASGQATFVSVFTAKSGETQPRLPGGEMVPDPAIEKGKEYVVKPDAKQRGVPSYSRRLKLAELLPRAETRGFARNIANRVWAQMLGRGLVHPLDLHHAANPPSHPDLLNDLESWLVAQRFDLKSLYREIALSNVYQLSSRWTSEGPPPAPDAFAVASLRGLTADQMSWSLLQATGRIEVIRRQAATRAKTPAKMSEPQTPEPQPQAVDATPAWKRELAILEPIDRTARTLAAVFAGLPGQADGEFQPVVDHVLHLTHSPVVASLVQDDQGGLLTRLKGINEPEPLADELHLSVLARFPDSDEVEETRMALADVQSPAERRERIVGLIWGKLLSAEFRLNH